MNSLRERKEGEKRRRKREEGEGEEGRVFKKKIAAEYIRFKHTNTSEANSLKSHGKAAGCLLLLR